jgi:hypothetical protein
MAYGSFLGLCMAALCALGSVEAHGGAHQKPLQIDPNAPWATRHMAGTFVFPTLLLTKMLIRALQ